MKTSNMDYEKLYKEAIARIRKYTKDEYGCTRLKPEDIFPELAKSEDVMIKEKIIATIHLYYGEPLEDEAKEMIAWFEKQTEQKLYVNDNAKEMFIKALESVEEQNAKGYKLTDCDKNSWWEDFKVYTTSEQNLSNSAKTCKDEQNHADKAEPKFKVGDWICHTVYKKPLLIVEDLGEGDFRTEPKSIITAKEFREGVFRLWTIQDAKDGDVLYTSSTASNEVFIFKELTIEGYIKCYCSYDSEDKYCEGKYHFIGKHTFMTHPATKEQRDLLFQKMKEAGYEWDAEKKELKKVEQKPWSEEDERKINYLIALLQNSTMNDDALRVMNEEVENWLKSLKPHWKPTDEQIKVLNEVINFAADHGTMRWNDYIYNVLKSLREKLKNL